MTDPLERQRQMVAKHPHNELARFSLGKALYDRGAWAEAREQLAEALGRRPDWMVVQILVGKCDLELGRKAEAVAAFERGLALAIEQHHEGPQEELQQLLAELKT
ncbi:MAG: molecular chaperone DnaJ [Verrucomicrobia bacterium]|nr:MAG: molecular chaperone DnaJ [Verrucomicrobiota bacterium]